MLEVLRLGHRHGRDDRISTHVGLTARQWGADEVVFSGDEDSSMIQSQRDIVDRWGGEISIRYENSWRKEISEFEGLRVHLTMYGERINEMEDVLRDRLSDEKDLLVIVGAEKVPRWVYENVEFNVSVGNQPHSEIAALAVFLDRVKEGEIKQEFDRAEIEVEPSEDRKLTREK